MLSAAYKSSSFAELAAYVIKKSYSCPVQWKLYANKRNTRNLCQKA